MIYKPEKKECENFRERKKNNNVVPTFDLDMFLESLGGPWPEGGGGVDDPAAGGLRPQAGQPRLRPHHQHGRHGGLNHRQRIR